MSQTNILSPFNIVEIPVDLFSGDASNFTSPAKGWAWQTVEGLSVGSHYAITHVVVQAQYSGPTPAISIVLAGSKIMSLVGKACIPLFSYRPVNFGVIDIAQTAAGTYDIAPSPDDQNAWNRAWIHTPLGAVVMSCNQGAQPQIGVACSAPGPWTIAVTPFIQKAE